MRKISTLKYCNIAFVAVLLLLAEWASSAPCSGNYVSNEESENHKGQEYQYKKNKSLDVRDLYELLLKKQALDIQPNQPYQVVRKSNRSPSLRLRFGKRGDLYAMNPKLTGDSYQFLEESDN